MTEHTEGQEPSLLVSQTEAGRLLGGISRTTIWRMLKEERLQGVEVGGRTMVTRQSVNAVALWKPNPWLDGRRG